MGICVCVCVCVELQSATATQSASNLRQQLWRRLSWPAGSNYIYLAVGRKAPRLKWQSASLSPRCVATPCAQMHAMPDTPLYQRQNDRSSSTPLSVFLIQTIKKGDLVIVVIILGACYCRVSRAISALLNSSQPAFEQAAGPSRRGTHASLI